MNSEKCRQLSLQLCTLKVVHGLAGSELMLMQPAGEPVMAWHGVMALGISTMLLYVGPG